MFVMMMVTFFFLPFLLSFRFLSFVCVYREGVCFVGRVVCVFVCVLRVLLELVADECLMVMMEEEEKK